MPRELMEPTAAVLNLELKQKKKMLSEIFTYTSIENVSQPRFAAKLYSSPNRRASRTFGLVFSEKKNRSWNESKNVLSNM